MTDYHHDFNYFEETDPSNVAKDILAKLCHRRNGPYVIIKKVWATSTVETTTSFELRDTLPRIRIHEEGPYLYLRARSLTYLGCA